MEVRIGKVTHFYNHINVAVLELAEPLQNGDKVRIRGHTTDFEQVVRSMQIEHKPVDAVGPGEDVALKVAGRVRKGDVVFKVVESEQSNVSA